jgi:hypothetical protein
MQGFLGVQLLPVQDRNQQSSSNHTRGCEESRYSRPNRIKEAAPITQPKLTSGKLWTWDRKTNQFGYDIAQYYQGSNFFNNR